jgi:hypothetical protein
METKFGQKKKSRGLTIAENKKNQEIKYILGLRDEMIANKINEKLIKIYLDEQYKKINCEYNKRIQKYQENEIKKQNNLYKKENKVKRKQAIDLLLKNKAFLEEKCYKPEYIRKYIEKEYNEINKTFYNIDLEQVEFID